MRRREKSSGGFLLGTAVGVAAGLVGGTALFRRAAASQDTIEVIGEQGDPAAAPLGTAERSAATAADQMRAMLDALRARWNEAIGAGKAAAAEHERELEAKLAFETKRIPPMEGQIIERVEERLHRGDNR